MMCVCVVCIVCVWDECMCVCIVCVCVVCVWWYVCGGMCVYGVCMCGHWARIPSHFCKSNPKLAIPARLTLGFLG